MIGFCAFLPLVSTPGHDALRNLYSVLLLETLCAVFDNIGASAYSTVVGFLDHVAYLTITYFVTTTAKRIRDLNFFSANGELKQGKRNTLSKHKNRWS